MSSSSEPRDTRPIRDSRESRDTRSAAQGGPFPNIAAPVGSKAGQSYSRFIPREELGAFKTWQPGAFSGEDRRGEERRKEDRGHADRRAGTAGPAAGAGVGTGTGTGVGAGASPSAAAAAAPAGPSAAEWQARITAARKAGYQDGYRDGLVALEGFKQSFAQQNTAQIGTLLNAWDEQLQAQDADMAQALARTAWLLAQQVLRCELQQRPDLVAEVARQAVNAVMHSARQVTVHVHPQDLPLVSQGADEALAARGARLRADSSVQRGGVLVNSDVGSVDARLDTRWAEAAAALGVVPTPALAAQQGADDEPAAHPLTQGPDSAGPTDAEPGTGLPPQPIRDEGAD